MKETSLDLFGEGDRKEPSVRQEQQEKSLMESRIALEKTVIEKGETTFRIISKSVREYQFTIPYNLPDTERVEVGQIFSVHDGGLTFLARVLDIHHDSNYDGNWDTTLRGTQFFDQDQIFNRVIAEPLGCVYGGCLSETQDNSHKVLASGQGREGRVRVPKAGHGRH